MKRIYMDHAATTPVDPEVVNAMLPYFTEYFGNASSIHSFGREAHEAMEDARGKIADIIGAKKSEIIFTAGGTESDNIALKGMAYKMRRNALKSRGSHIITSCIEHPAVLETCRYLEKQGFKVKYLPVDKYGIIDINELEESISKDTFMISIMHANNEIGTVEPVEEIGEIARGHNIVFHTDTVQSVGKVPIDVKKMNIDMLSLSSHKIYGPKGIGALFIRNGIKTEPLVHGGGHEKGIRSSTENIPGIVGFGKAIEIAKASLEEGENKHLGKLRDGLIKGVLNIPDSRLNGHPTRRLPNNAHFSFDDVEGESIVMHLDLKGIAASTGSACSTKKVEPNHVLLAIGLTNRQAFSSLRLTLGWGNTEKDVEYLLSVLPGIIKNLREITPRGIKNV